jgi:hypothetical protein
MSVCSNESPAGAQQRHLQRPSLRCRQHVQLDTVAQVGERGEGERRLRLGRPAREHAAVAGSLERIAQQRRLADPRLALHEHRRGPSRAREEVRRHGSFGVPADDHVSILQR